MDFPEAQASENARSPMPVGINCDRDCRSLFVPAYAAVQKRQQQHLISLFVCTGVGVLGHGGMSLASRYGYRGVPIGYFMTLMAAGYGSAILLLFLRPGLWCVRCDKNLERRWQHFCSECGSGNLDHPPFVSWRTLPRCTVCGGEPTRQGRGNTRLYKIRFCTHCGVYLSEEGV